MTGRRRRPLDRSGAAEADRDFARLDDHGDIALVVRQFEHPLESCRVLQDVDVIERNVALGIRLTGVARVGSEILAEDQNFVGHRTRIQETEFRIQEGPGILISIFWLLSSEF